MQLILETEKANIDIKEKMSLMLEQEPLSEQIIVNGNPIPDSEVLDAAGSELPTVNADTNHIKNNILDASEDNVTAPVPDKKIEEVQPSSPCTTDNALSEANIDDEILPEAVTLVEESSTYFDNDIGAPQLCSNVNDVLSNGKDNVKSQDDIPENVNSEEIEVPLSLPTEMGDSIEKIMEVDETLDDIVVAGNDNNEDNSVVIEEIQSASKATVEDKFEMDLESKIVKGLDIESINGMNLQGHCDSLKTDNTLGTNAILNKTKLVNEPEPTIPSDEGNLENEKLNDKAYDDQKKEAELLEEEVCQQPIEISVADENQLLNSDSELDINCSDDNAMECDDEFDVAAQTKNTVPPKEDFVEKAPSTMDNIFKRQTSETKEDLIEIAATGTESIFDSRQYEVSDVAVTENKDVTDLSMLCDEVSVVTPNDIKIDETIPVANEKEADVEQKDVIQADVQDEVSVVTLNDTKIDETIPVANEKVADVEQKDVIQAEVQDEVSVGEIAAMGTENISETRTPVNAMPPKDLVDKVPSIIESISDSRHYEVSDVSLTENKDVTDISMDCVEVSVVTPNDIKIDETIPVANEKIAVVEQSDVIQADAQDEVSVVTLNDTKIDETIPVANEKVADVEQRDVIQADVQDEVSVGEIVATGTESISETRTTVNAVPPKDLVNKVPSIIESISDSRHYEVSDVSVTENKDGTDIFMDCDEVSVVTPNDIKIDETIPVANEKVADVEQSDVIQADVQDEVSIVTLNDTKIDETIPVANEKVAAAERREAIQADVSDEMTKTNIVSNDGDETDVLSNKPEETVVANNNKDGVPTDNKNLPEEFSQEEDVIMDMKVAESIEEIVDVDEIESKSKDVPVATERKKEKDIIQTLKLSNTLDILSDDDDEPVKVKNSQDNKVINYTEKQCINLDDDDDVMLIDEDVITKEDKIETSKSVSKSEKISDETNSDPGSVTVEDDSKNIELCKESDDNAKETASPAITFTDLPKSENNENYAENVFQKFKNPKPLLPENFLKLYKKNVTDMTRDDLEEFCILKIVESIIDRSNLTEIRTKLKSMTQNIEEYKKKAMVLTKQNRDLQVVLKSVQEEQKKCGNTPITPLKITRSVGMQVLMPEKTRKKGTPVGPNTNVRPVRSTANQNSRHQSQANSQQIPVPRLIPAAVSNTTAMKPPSLPQTISPKNPGKGANIIPNGVRCSPPAQKAEKRPHNKMLTVDLTDDEPPSKVITRNTAPPVRLVSPQNLMAPRAPQAQTAQTGNNPRKVFIPISGPPGQNVRGGAVMLRNVTPSGPRPRAQLPMVRIPQNAVRMARAQGGRHPAPLPDAMKQYQPPNWKALPPAPDLKLSKVENGIVISWKIEGYQEDSYEEIASYQLYAYQETTSPPSTALWKKIGDVKALPLPMACTLTQFMAGYKYYFAVRAVDVRSRLGPFSLPGSILLLNKV